MNHQDAMDFAKGSLFQYTSRVVNLARCYIDLVNKQKRTAVFLSDDDIYSVCMHWMSIGVSKTTMFRFIRAIEKAVLRINGYEV